MGRSKQTNAPYKSNFERKVAEYLKAKGVKFGYETEKVVYMRPTRSGECLDCSSPNVGINASYYPDFVLSNGIYLETKGKFDSQGRSKILNVLASNNVLSRENFRLLFMRDNYITKKRLKTYSEWCDDHDIEWGIGPEVPDKWLL